MDDPNDEKRPTGSDERESETEDELGHLRPEDLELRLKKLLVPETGPRWHPLARVIAYFLAVGPMLQLVVGIPGAILWVLIMGGGISGDRTATNEGDLLIFVHILLAPATLFVTRFFLRHLDRRSMSEIGLRLPSSEPMRQAFLCSLATAGLLGLWLALLSALSNVDFLGWSREYATGPAFWPGIAGRIVATTLILGGFLLQGGTEELIYRGYIYTNLKDRWGWVNAAGASSFLFALVHGVNPNVTPMSLINTFLLGVVMALLVEAAGSLWIPAIFHGIWNFLQGHVLGLPVSGIDLFGMLDVEITGSKIWTGGPYGPEGSLILTYMLLPLTFFFAYRLARRRPAGLEGRTRS